ncbi:MAG: PIN domain-containing protein [Jatrophihabitans sp.]|uniref:PIN domain-containing protein n=1 Tax=Jatrophihabitans sp. TaxID=1932789 RepID=UPI003F80EFA4
MRALLDTSVLLGPAVELGDVEVAISAISLAELHFGVLVARDPAIRSERLRRLGTIEATFDALPVDDAVAREYGRLAARTVDVGRQPRRRVSDLLIAATARVVDAELWTRNAADFDGLDDLVMIRALTSD